MNIIINENQDDNHDRLVLEAIMRGEATSQLHFGIDNETGEMIVDWYQDEQEQLRNDILTRNALPKQCLEEPIRVAEMKHMGVVFGWGEYEVCAFEEVLRINAVFLDSSKSEFVPDLFTGFGRVAITQRFGRCAI